MVHLNITFPEELKSALDRQARQDRVKRSTMIQMAVKVYLDLKKKRALVELMKEGYQEMAEENRAILKEFETLDRESLKYAD